MAIRLGGMISGLDTDAIVKELMSAQSLKKTAVEQKKEKLGWKKERWEEMNTKIYSFYTEKLSNLKLQGSYLTKKVSSSNEEKAKATATTAANGSYSLEIKKLATAQYVTGADISSKNLTKKSKLVDAGMASGQTITIKTGKDLDTVNTIEVTDDMSITDFVSKLSALELNASFDEANGRFYVSAKASGDEGMFTIESSAAAGAGLDALGIGNIDQALATSGQTAADSTTMAVVAAGNASIVLNGATVTSSSNTIVANGLTLELTGATAAGEVISLTVANDVDSVYDKVKDFVKSYNELLNEMYDKYNAASAKGYNMLTDEEKEAMTDDQVKLWEDKIKDSLLRRDDNLNSLMTAFRAAMQKTVEVGGKSYSLASYGIVTGVYTEHGILHIEGDTEDGTYGDKEDRLKTALAQDPEAVSKTLSEIMNEFYKTLTDKMSASSISSALTFYNDKQIQSQMDGYEKEVSTWERRLEDMEDRYYKQFAGMEKAMANLQSQQNSLNNMLGL